MKVVEFSSEMLYGIEHIWAYFNYNHDMSRQAASNSNGTQLLRPKKGKKT
jgi:hypothetical protein